MRRLLPLVLFCVALNAMARVRVALPQPSQRVAGDQPAPALLSFLHEWSAAHQHLQPIDRQRVADICTWLDSGAFTLPPDAFFNTFNAIQPLDAWISVRDDKGETVVAIATAGGMVEMRLPGDALPEFRATLRKTCAFIEKSLNVPADPAALALLDELTTDAAAVAYCLAPLTSERWPRNSGAARLDRLRPHWSMEHSGPAMAGAILQAALEQVTARTRSQEFTPQVIAAARAALPKVLGTRHEQTAARLLQEAPVETFREILLDLARKVAEDELLVVPNINLNADPLAASAPHALPAADPLGAIRLLGYLRDDKQTLAMLQLLATAPTPTVRRAAVQALLNRAEPAAAQTLAALAKDGDARVALLARLGAWRQAPDANPPPLRETRQLLPTAGDLLWAVAEVLTKAGTSADLPALRALQTTHDTAIRRDATMALVRLEPQDIPLLLASLDDPDATVMRLTLLALATNQAAINDAIKARLMTLCNDPQAGIGEAARLAVYPLRPADQWARLAFDLATEHPWQRRTIIATLAADQSPQALDLLRQACANSNPRTRATALAALAEHDVAASRAAASRALRDPHRRVRLQGAALLERHATTAERAAIAAAAATEQDAATRLYLETAIARLDNAPLAPRPAAHSAAQPRTLTWMCGMGIDAATSPYSAYYCLSLNVNDTWRAAHAAGKVCFARLDVVSQPGLAVLDPTWEDRSWLSIARGLPLADLDVVDGVVYGEETMNFNTTALWPAGWRLFCMEAGIDPVTVAGKFDALGRTQKMAWERWALERHIDGFNQLYDDTKLRFALLRPGLQVATFMAEQGGPTPADRRWKFDVGGIYDYKGSNRACYYLIRRLKTLWPERPIIWLALGIGGYEMNPVKYDLTTPAAPMHSRNDRAYADNLSAWLAGADPGFFSTWIFVRHNFSGGMGNLSGVQILLEDIAPRSGKLASGIEFAFANVEKVYAPAVKAPEAPGATALGGNLDDAIFAALDAEKEKKAAIDIKKRIEKEKAQMRDGFLYYRQYLDTVATIFNELPRRDWRSPFLGVKSGLSVWSRATDWAPTTALNLLPECDFLADINKLPEIGATHYRTMVVANSTRFTDAAIAHLSAWLRDAPNLLIVSGWLPVGLDAGTPTVANLDGLLTQTWPWAKDVTTTAVEKPAAAKEVALSGKSAITLEQATIVNSYAGQNVTPLWQHRGAVVCALWRAPGFQGAVIFDGVQQASPAYADALRDQINALASQGIGLPLPQSHFVVSGTAGHVTAAASAPVKNARGPALPGTEWLSGADTPSPSRWRSAAITAAEFSGEHVLCHLGMVVVSATPLTSVTRGADSLTFTASGLFQVSGGDLTFAAAGAPLPERALDAAWLFHKGTPGLALQTWEEDNQTRKRWFVRSPQPVTITR